MSGAWTAKDVMEEIARQAPTMGIAPDVATALFIAENSADGKILPTRVIKGATASPKGARGVMQVMPHTMEGLKATGFLSPEHQHNPTDLASQVREGLAAIKEKQARQKTPDDPLELAAMYNGGNNAWMAYRTGQLDKLPAETKHYFTKVKTALGQKPGATMSEQTITPASSATPPSTMANLRSSVYDPEALSAAMSSGVQLIKAGGTIDTATNMINQAITSRKAIEAEQQEAIQATAQAEAAQTLANTAITANQAARRRDILTTAGLNADTATNRANAAMAAIMAESVKAEALGAEIDSRMAVSMFDNPLEWMVNQVRLPGMVGAYNAIAEGVNRKRVEVANLQTIANNQISLNQAMDADLITKHGVTQAAVTASKAQEALKKAQADTAGAAIRDAETAINLGATRFRTAATMADMTKQVMSENAGMNEKAAAKEAEKLAVTQVNNYLKMIGSTTQHTVDTFTKMLPRKEQERLLEASGTGRIGKTLYESAIAVNEGGNLDNIAASGDAAATVWVRGTLGEAREAVSKDLAAAKAQSRITGKPVKEEEFFKAAVDKMQDVYTGQLQDLRTASKFNPYKLDYPTAVKDPALQNNVVTKFYAEYGPTSKAPMFTQLDENIMMQQLGLKIAAGQLTVPQAAADVSKFYTTAAKLQAERTKYVLFGLNAPRNGYTVVLPGANGGLFSKNLGATGSVDLTNQAAVEAALTTSTAFAIRDLMQQQQMQPGGFNMLGNLGAP
jgi:hypothetical protein